MNGTNWGQQLMCAVVLPSDQWIQFMTSGDLHEFLATGNRALLHIPNLNVNSNTETID
jgi:hypothetical protein